MIMINKHCVLHVKVISRIGDAAHKMSFANRSIFFTDCNPNPCHNSGNCLTTANNYTCTCSTGFTGNNCQIQGKKSKLHTFNKHER